MNEGWVKLHRKLQDSSFVDKPLIGWLFINLLLLANHKEHKFLWNKEEIIIKEGQCITGRKELSKLTGISEQSIRTGLNVLKSTNTLTIKSTSKFSLISIVNWSIYQGQSTIKSTKQLTNDQPTTNQQLTTYKNDNNEKNDNNGGATEKISNSLILSKQQLMAFAKEFPGLTTGEILIQRQKCNAYMNMSSNNYTNPGLFFKGWLDKYHKELKTKELVAAETKRILNSAPEISEEQRHRNIARLAEMRKTLKIGGIK